MVAAHKINDTKLETNHAISVAIMGIAAFFSAPTIFPSVSQIAVGMIAMIATHLVLKLLKK